MSWKWMRKPAIFAASIALVAGIAPMVAFADEAVEVEGEQPAAEMTAQADGPIDTVNFSVTQPVAGTSVTASDESAMGNVTVSGEDLELYKAHWLDDEANLFGGTFVEGQSYTLAVLLKAARSMEQHPTVNAENATMIERNDNPDILGAVDGKDLYQFLLSVAAVNAGTTSDTPTDNTSATTDDEVDTPAATDDKADTPAATDETPATTDEAATKATTENATAATEAAATESTTDTTASTSTSASTMPKAGDALPLAPASILVALSAVALLVAWRKRSLA